MVVEWPEGFHVEREAADLPYLLCSALLLKERSLKVRVR